MTSSQIQRHARQAAIMVIAQREARVQNPTGWLGDNEIELAVSVWLWEDDPAFQVEDGPILVPLHLVGLSSRGYGIDIS